MHRRTRSILLGLVTLAVAILCAAPSPAAPARGYAGRPSPSNLDAVPDATQLTGLRVALPKPDCTVQVTACQSIDGVNQLDGFGVYPRLSIPFSRPIDVDTVSSSDVLLVDVASGQRIPLGRFVWTTSTNTLHAYPDVFLRQDTQYLLAVTNEVEPVTGGGFARGLGPSLAPQIRTHWADAYRNALGSALAKLGALRGHVIAASLFRTQSITSFGEKVRDAIDASTPAPVGFDLGAGGARTVFPLHDVTVRVNQNEGSTPAGTTWSAAGDVCSPVATVAFGAFASPRYETAQGVIPQIPTRETPTPDSIETVYVNLYLPKGTPPPGGWPVAILGHGNGGTKEQALGIASMLAKNGVATIAMNAADQAGSPLGTLTVTTAGGTLVTLPSGGRALASGTNGPGGTRQTALDLLQLVREIRVGVDVDGDGAPDLDPRRISYLGVSLGGNYGAIFLALDRHVHAGVLTVVAGATSEDIRLSPTFRPRVGFALLHDVPVLYNAIPNATLTNFDEDLPLRGEPVRVDDVTGADAIQDALDWYQWTQNLADPGAYSPYLRESPLPSVSAKALIVQFAKGDQTAPNPGTSIFLRSGGLADVATYFRSDLAAAAVPDFMQYLANPHGFLGSISGDVAPFAYEAQQQIATFFATDGRMTVDPDGPVPVFETPIAGPLPDTLNFLP